MSFWFTKPQDITSIFMGSRSVVIAKSHSLPCTVIAGTNHYYKIDVIIFSFFYMIYMYMHACLKYNYIPYIPCLQQWKFAPWKIIEKQNKIYAKLLIEPHTMLFFHISVILLSFIRLLNDFMKKRMLIFFFLSGTIQNYKLWLLY